MHTLDDILQLLEVSQETLTEILNACGWGSLTQFTDEQSEILIAVNDSHTNHNWPYLESYLRKVADGKGLTPEKYDELADTIAQAGGTLLDYRDSFEEICQRVSNGAPLMDAVMPPQDKPVELSDIAAEMPAVNGENPLADLSPEELEFVTENAKTAATVTLSRMQGFADKAAEQQEKLEKAFLYQYRQELAKKLLDPQFKAQFTLRLQRRMDGKKPLENELAGAVTTIPLLSSTS